RCVARYARASEEWLPRYQKRRRSMATSPLAPKAKSGVRPRPTRLVRRETVHVPLIGTAECRAQAHLTPEWKFLQTEGMLAHRLNYLRVIPANAPRVKGDQNRRSGGNRESSARTWLPLRSRPICREVRGPPCE